MSKSYKWIILLITSVVFIACVKKDRFETGTSIEDTWNPQLAIPLLLTEIGVEGLFASTDSSSALIDGKNISLIYGSQQSTFSTKNLITLDDINTENLPIIYSTSEVQLPPIPLDTINSVKIASILLGQGSLEINTTSSSVPAELTFTFLDIKDIDNQPLKVTVGTGSSITKSLENYTVEPTNGVIRSTIKSNMNGSCYAKVHFNNLDFERLTGYFKDEPILLQDSSFNLHLFKNIAKNGEIIASNTKLTITAKNSFGMSFQPFFENVFAINVFENEKVPLIKGTNTDKFEILGSVNKGQSTTSQFVFNRDNSNITSFIGNGPKIVHYQIEAQVENTPPLPQTIFKDSKLDLEIALEIPLEGRVISLEILDTIDFKLSSNFSNFESLLIKTYTENGFPLETKIKLTLMGRGKQILKKKNGMPMELINGIFTRAAPVDKSTGVVTQSIASSSDFSQIDSEILNSLPLAKYCQLQAIMSTTNDGKDDVKIQSNYRLKVQIGANIKGIPNLTY